MGNPYKGEVSFEADGKQQTISYSFNAFAELQELLKMNPTQLSAALAAGVDPIQMRLMFMIGLADHAFRNALPAPSLDEVKRICSHLVPKDGIELLGRALHLAFADEAKGNSAIPPEARIATGNGPASSHPGNP